MEKAMMNIEKELGELKSGVNNAHKRIDDLQVITKAFYDLASDVKVMVNEMTNMKKDIKEIKGNIDEYHKVEPNKLIFNVKNTVITAIAAAIVGALIALVLK
jgi:uncharacterized coiled-coil DUF342 family protein